MKKGFVGGMFGCFGVLAAVIVIIIVVVALSNAGNKSGAGSSGSPKPAGTKVLLDVSGNGSKTTEKFHAPDDWTIDYTYDCSAFGQSGNFAITVQGDTFDLAANQLGTKGTDKANVHAGGNVYLNIASECNWHVTAKG